MTDTNAPINRSAPVPDERAQRQSGDAGQVARVTGGLRVGQKLALAGAVFALPIAALLGFLVTEQQRNINFVNTELTGYEYLLPTRQLFQQMQNHAQNSVTYLQGVKTAAAPLNQATVQIEAAIKSLKALDARDGGSYEVSAALSRFETNWKAVRDGVTSGRLSSERNIPAHAQLLSQIGALFGVVANSSQIALDPEANAYYLGQAATVQFPKGFPIIGRTRASSLVAIVANKPITDVQKIEYGFRLSEARAAQADILGTLKYTSAAGSDRAVRSRYEQSINELLDTFENKVAAPLTPTIGLADYRKLIGSSNAAAYALFDNVLADLRTQLETRKAGYQRNRLLTLGLVALTLALAIALLALIARAITRPLTRLTSAAQSLGQGDLNVQVPIESRDEIGVLAGAFNQTAAQLRENEVRNSAARVESEKLQNNIGQFLDVTMNIADGDLTQRGKVSDDVLGNVVDSINVMVEELGGVLRGVRTASGSVSQASLEMLGTTDQIVRGADSTAAQTVRVAAQVQDVIAGIREMNTAAQQSADVARQSLVASQQGREAVLGTLDGMQNIRREVQGVARRIKTLGERSLEIQEIVDTISRLSRQTNLLALNASIEAAGAGTAGTRFAIVADEVRKLADSSAEATGRIASLIRTVQLEISEVVSSVEDGTREVEQGYKVASTAGERLGDLGRLAAEAAQFAEAISAATGQQVSSIEQMGAAVSQIGEVAEQSRLSVQQGRAAAERLRPLTQDLDSSLERFQLPV
jgi:twitching motility protein PilJ